MPLFANSWNVKHLLSTHYLPGPPILVNPPEILSLEDPHLTPDDSDSVKVSLTLVRDPFICVTSNVRDLVGQIIVIIIGLVGGVFLLLVIVC